MIRLRRECDYECGMEIIRFVSTGLIGRAKIGWKQQISASETTFIFAKIINTLSQHHVQFLVMSIQFLNHDCNLKIQILFTPVSEHAIRISRMFREIIVWHSTPNFEIRSKRISSESDIGQIVPIRDSIPIDLRVDTVRLWPSVLKWNTIFIVFQKQKN